MSNVFTATHVLNKIQMMLRAITKTGLDYSSQYHINLIRNLLILRFLHKHTHTILRFSDVQVIYNTANMI